MEYMGSKCLRLRSNLWGEFRILEGGIGGYAVHCLPSGIHDRRDAPDSEKLYLCGTRKQAETRLKYEATKHKRYRYF